MEIEGFQFNIGELNGCRLLEIVFPAAVDSTKLSMVVSSYYGLWDEPRPTVTLSDVSALADFDDQARGVLQWVAQRTQYRPELLASSFVTGGHEVIRFEVKTILTEAGRDPEILFDTREEAFAYLRECIQRRLGTAGAEGASA